MLSLLLLLACGGGQGADPALAVPVSEPIAPSPSPQPAAAPQPPAVSLVVPAEVSACATQLELVERTLREAAFADELVQTHAHLQQRIYRDLALDRVKAEGVLRAVPEDLRSVVARNIEATRAISRTVRRPRVKLPAWRVVAPPPAAELQGYYREAEASSGVPWHVLAAVHLVETRMGRLRGTSIAGARGPMQFMPATWEAYAEGDILDDHDAILGAGSYLAAMGASRDLKKALWHYNHSDAYVSSVLTWSEIMREEPILYRAYHGWQVYYRTVRGTLWLQEGFEATEPGPIGPYCERVGAPACPPHEPN